MRIVVLALEALPNARAVRRFVHARGAEIVLVGLSDPRRRAVGGAFGQVRRHLVRSGPRFLPYLAVNFGIPDLLRPAAPLMQAAAGTPGLPEATPLRRLCADRGIPVADVEDVDGPAFAAVLDEARADLLVTFHFDQILSGATIARARLGGLNVHPGLLPRHRGPVPTIHALADGDRAFGITIHRLTEAIDDGAVLAQEGASFDDAITATRAARVLHDRAVPLLDGVLDEIARTGAIPAGRIVASAPYRPFPSRALLADMRRRRLRLVDAADLAEAMTLTARPR